MPRFIRMWLFSALISFTALGMWKGLEWYYNEDIEDVAPITVSAIDLAISYDEDEDFSSLVYDGNYVIITGQITNMGNAGSYYTVNLVGYSYISIDLSFYNADEIEKVANANIGDIITVRGKVDGLNASYIVITNCTLE